MKAAVFFVVSLLLLLLAVGCGSGEEEAGVQEVALTASDIAYDRTQLEVVAGLPVRLTMHNEGVLEHDFSIMDIHMSEAPHSAEGESEEHMMDMDHMAEEPELHAAVMPGMDNTVEFTPLEAGEYEYFCAVPGHKEAGMHGTLIVREP